MEANTFAGNHSEFNCVGYLLVIPRVCDDACATETSARTEQ